MQLISQTPYDRNSKLLVGYLSHDLNNKPFDEQTILGHLNTELVHAIQYQNFVRAHFGV